MEKNIKIKCLMTEEEQESILKLRELLNKNKINYKQAQFDDAYLLRFVRARKDIKSSYDMFVKFLEWRTENNVDYLQVNILIT